MYDTIPFLHGTETFHAYTSVSIKYAPRHRNISFPLPVAEIYICLLDLLLVTTALPLLARHYAAKGQLHSWPPHIPRPALSHLTIRSGFKTSRYTHGPRAPMHHTAPAYWFFRAYRDSRSIPGHTRSPATSDLKLAFIALTAGSYSDKTTTNHILKVRV